MAMLHMYTKKTQAVCVVNYNKRDNSAIDTQIVVDYCKLHNIKYYVHIVPQKTYEINAKQNFQALARTIRYNFFREVCILEKNANLMVAHNLNDHLETAYMQFARKSRALFYGIKPKSTYLGLKITRPLISLQKSTILRYCNQHSVKYALDYTNEMDIYERNKVRKIIFAWTPIQIMQFIKKVRSYNHLHAKEYKNVNKYFKKWAKSMFRRDELLEFPIFYRYFLIYEFLKFHQEKNNNYQKIEAVLDFIKINKPHTKYRLEQKRFLTVSEGLVVIK